MNESRSNQNTGTKVLAEEEDLRGNLHPLDLLGNHWETTATNGSKEDNDCCLRQLLGTSSEYHHATYKLQPRGVGSRTPRHRPHSRTLAFQT